MQKDAALNNLLISNILVRSKTWFVKHLVDGLLVAAVVIISFSIFGPNLQANWWIVDDHEIAVYTGTDGSFSFREIIPTLFTKTEINPASTLGRFRPAYYFLRLLETRLWIRNAPMDWYLTRILIFIFFMVVLYLFFKKINGQIIGALLTLFCTNSLFWVDIFGRLGPSETYAVFGAGLFALGFLRYLQKKSCILVWILLTLGTILCIGSKENFLIILLPYLLILVNYIREKPTLKARAWVSAAICLLWTGWIFFNLFIRINQTGADIYSNSVSLADRFARLGEYLSTNGFVIIAPALLLVIGLLAYFFWKNDKAKAPARVVLIGASLDLILVLSQVFFYSGQFEGRYFFPYYLFLPITISLFIYLFQQYAWIRANVKLDILFTLLACAGLIFSIKADTWTKMNDESWINVRRTQFFMEKVNQISGYLHDHPNTEVIFYGTNPGYDYEPIDSYEQYFRAREVSNRFFILRDPPADYRSTYSKLALRLEEELIQKSKDGDPAWTISPLSELTAGSQSCVLITLLYDHSSPIQCDVVFDGNVFIDYQGLE